jgi:U3 small nucleolar RNA-associated protein 23
MCFSCEHEKVVSAVDCILSLVGEKNPEHYFVATQDSDLREKLREVYILPFLSPELHFSKESVQGHRIQLTKIMTSDVAETNTNRMY